MGTGFKMWKAGFNRSGLCIKNIKVCQDLTGEEPITVYEMFAHADEYQIGERHSQDK